MAMDLRQANLRAMLIAAQAVAGTPTTLVPATHGMLVLNGDFNFRTDELTDERDMAGHGAQGHLNVKRRSQYTGGIELRGAAVVGEAAPCGIILRACGFGETLEEDVSAIYALVDTGYEMVSIGGYNSGTLVSGLDARGAITRVEMSIRNFAKAQFDILALPGAVPVSDANLPETDLDAFQYPVPIETESFEVDIGGTKLNTVSLTVDTNAQVEIYEGSERRFVYLRQMYRPSGVIKVFKEQRATFHPENVALAHTLQNIYAEIVGGGETTRLDLTSVQLGMPTQGEQDGIVTWDIPFKARGTTPTNCMALSVLEP